jgi:hypothetical protein
MSTVNNSASSLIQMQHGDTNRYPELDQVDLDKIQVVKVKKDKNDIIKEKYA